MIQPYQIDIFLISLKTTILIINFKVIKFIIKNLFSISIDVIILIVVTQFHL